MKKLIALITISLTLASCFVPANTVYNFETINQNQLWLNGKEFIKLENNVFQTVINYDRSLHGIISFDLAIKNRSSETIILRPQDFHIEVTKRFDEKEDIFAINPEQKIYQINKNIERSVASNKSNNQTDLLLTLFSYANEFTDKDITSERKKELSEEREKNLEYADKRNKNNLSKINILTSQRNSLQNQAFRKTTLLPGQQMNGKIYFAISNGVKHLTLYLPIKNIIEKIEYQKIEF